MHIISEPRDWRGDFAKAAAKLLATALLTAGVICSATAAAIAYDFDGFDGATALTAGYAGLTFRQSTVLKAGQSHNHSVFPLRSADGVVCNDGGPIGPVQLDRQRERRRRGCAEG